MTDEAPTLLLVDDKEDNLFVLEQVLRQHLPNCRVISASSPREGLEAAGKYPLDGAMVDMQMPGMDGIEFCRQLRARDETAKVPVILITAHRSTAQLRAGGLEAGADDFITRPIDNVELIARVRAMLRIKRAEDKLRAVNADLEQQVLHKTATLRDYHRAVESSQDLIAVISPGYTYQVVNASFLEHHGLERSRALGLPVWSVLGEELFASTIKPNLDRCLEGETVQFELARTLAGTGECHLQVRYCPLLGSGGKTEGVVAIARDVTARKRAEEKLNESEKQLRYLAYHDFLTGLPNRLLFQDRLQQALAKARRSGRQAALLFLDLDRFKNINDSLGHEVGDRLLQEVAKRLLECVREVDTVARLGGDEFLILLEEIEGIQPAATVAKRILRSLEQDIQVGNFQLFVTTSIGISIFPDHGADVESLMKFADVAMYRAKEQGRDNFKFYSPEMNVRSQELLLLEGDLRRGLEQEQFELFYQPQIDLATGSLIGSEALLRWNHPVRGMLSPAEFIPLAEETGLIVPIGEWVLRRACAQNRAWHQKGVSSVRVAVNISGRQFKKPGFIDLVDRVLKETGLDPGLLELEITESIVMEDVAASIGTLADLKRRGIHLAIDDFGTGYSSLSYLKRFPISTLKIDRSFVRDITTDPEDAAIVVSVIALARSMNLDVIAEGVETEEQKRFLQEQGCGKSQGFLYSRPVPPGEFSPWLESHL